MRLATATPRPGAANRRYLRRYALAMVAYTAVLVPVVWISGAGHMPPAPWSYVLSAAPALPVIAVVWALLRYLAEEEDEYLRMVATRTYLVASGLTYALTTAWGFLQAFAGVPKISLVWVFIIACGFQALATAWTYLGWRR